MPDADTLSLTDAVAAVQHQIDAYKTADAAVRKHDDAAERERSKRAAAKTALYELQDAVAGNTATMGAVAALLREAGISLPPSRRSA